MPQRGFKSITIRADIYGRLGKVYQDRRAALSIKGIRSLSGYITHLLDERMCEAHANHHPPIRMVSFSDSRAVLMDIKANRVAEVVAENGTLLCRLCGRNDCLHVGFAHAMPEINGMLRSQEGSVAQ